MATYKITISDRTNKSKYLLGLIKEMAKSDKYIRIEDNLDDSDTKEEIIVSIKRGVREAKEIEAGRMKGIPFDKLIEELRNED